LANNFNPEDALICVNETSRGCSLDETLPAIVDRFRKYGPDALGLQLSYTRDPAFYESADFTGQVTYSGFVHPVREKAWPRTESQVAEAVSAPAVPPPSSPPPAGSF